MRELLVGLLLVAVKCDNVISLHNPYTSPPSQSEDVNALASQLSTKNPLSQLNSASSQVTQDLNAFASQLSSKTPLSLSNSPPSQLPQSLNSLATEFASKIPLSPSNAAPQLSQDLNSLATELVSKTPASSATNSSLSPLTKILSATASDVSNKKVTEQQPNPVSTPLQNLIRTNYSSLSATQDLMKNLFVPVLPKIARTPRSNEPTKCENAEVLIKVWTVLSNLIGSDGQLVKAPSVNHIKYAMTLIKKYLQERKDNAQNLELANKLFLLETELAKEKGVVLKDHRPLRTMLNQHPGNDGAAKMAFKFEVQNNIRPSCREAFKTLIQSAEEAYLNLANNPVCNMETVKPTNPYENLELSFNSKVPFQSFYGQSYETNNPFDNANRSEVLRKLFQLLKSPTNNNVRDILALIQRYQNNYYKNNIYLNPDNDNFDYNNVKPNNGIHDYNNVNVRPIDGNIGYNNIINLTPNDGNNNNGNHINPNNNNFKDNNVKPIGGNIDFNNVNVRPIDGIIINLKPGDDNNNNGHYINPNDNNYNNNNDGNTINLKPIDGNNNNGYYIIPNDNNYNNNNVRPTDGNVINLKPTDGNNSGYDNNFNKNNVQPIGGNIDFNNVNVKPTDGNIINLKPADGNNNNGYYINPNDNNYNNNNVRPFDSNIDFNNVNIRPTDGNIINLKPGNENNNNGYYTNPNDNNINSNNVKPIDYNNLINLKPSDGYNSNGYDINPNDNNARPIDGNIINLKPSDDNNNNGNNINLDNGGNGNVHFDNNINVRPGNGNIDFSNILKPNDNNNNGNNLNPIDYNNNIVKLLDNKPSNLHNSSSNGNDALNLPLNNPENDSNRKIINNDIMTGLGNAKIIADKILEENRMNQGNQGPNQLPNFGAKFVTVPETATSGDVKNYISFGDNGQKKVPNILTGGDGIKMYGAPQGGTYSYSKKFGYGIDYNNPSLQDMLKKLQAQQQFKLNNYPELTKKYVPDFSSLLVKGNSNQIGSNKVVPNQCCGTENDERLDSIPQGDMELTYLLKRQQPLIYQPFYYIKYRMPYNYFAQNIRQQIAKAPNTLRTSSSDLYKNLIANAVATEVSPELAYYPKEIVQKLVMQNGALVKAKFIQSKESEGLKEPVVHVHDVNQLLNNTQKAVINAKELVDPNVNTAGNLEKHFNNVVDTYENMVRPARDSRIHQIGPMNSQNGQASLHLMQTLNSGGYQIKPESTQNAVIFLKNQAELLQRKGLLGRNGFNKITYGRRILPSYFINTTPTPHVSELYQHPVLNAKEQHKYAKALLTAKDYSTLLGRPDPNLYQSIPYGK